MGLLPGILSILIVISVGSGSLAQKLRIRIYNTAQAAFLEFPLYKFMQRWSNSVVYMYVHIVTSYPPPSTLTKLAYKYFLMTAFVPLFFSQLLR